MSYVFPTDGPTIVSGGYGLLSLVSKAPQPNAAKLYINWLAGPGPQLAFCEALRSVSLRSDLKYKTIPDYAFLRKGVKYLDSYDMKFVSEQRNPAMAKARDLLGE